VRQRAHQRAAAAPVVLAVAAPRPASLCDRGGLNIGHLYQILDRLSRDGLIDSERQPQQVKPDRLGPSR
jgi:hypothetical protein